jgi:chorismate mutase-like protein
MKTLDECRREIDRIDEALLDLLNERMRVVERVGEIKHATGGAIYRPEREKAIIERLSKMSKEKGGILNQAAIEALYLEIFAVSRNLELPERIAYLGPEGSFTHQAAESRFGAMSEYLSLGSIHSVFKTLEAGRAKFGVVPIENSRDGVVGETLDLLAKSPVKIVAELYMPIHMALRLRRSTSRISSVSTPKTKGSVSAGSFCRNMSFCISNRSRSNRRQRRLSWRRKTLKQRRSAAISRPNSTVCRRCSRISKMCMTTRRASLS